MQIILEDISQGYRETVYPYINESEFKVSEYN